MKAFRKLKEIESALLHVIEENVLLVVEMATSDMATALNQANHSMAFFSQSLKFTEQKYATVEKAASAIIEAVKRWSHNLSG